MGNKIINLETLKYYNDKIIEHINDSIDSIETDKQDTLVSGSNIKTINGESILGEGDLIIEAGFSNANVQAVDTTEILDDIETNTYVKYVAQTLTEEQKAQVRENIGVEENIDLSGYATKDDLSSKQNAITDLEVIRQGAAKGATSVQQGTLSTVATSGSYNDLTNKPTIPNAVSESTVSSWGFTKNTGTYIKPSTGIPKTDLASAVQTSLAKADTALQTETYKGTVTGVKVNGTTKNPSNGVVDLGTVITSHQDISGKQDTLVSGTNIKTLNGESILGSGDITISGTQVQSDWNETDSTNPAYIVNKPFINKTLTNYPGLPDGEYLNANKQMHTSILAVNEIFMYGNSMIRFSDVNYLSKNGVGMPMFCVEGNYIVFNASGNGTQFLSNDGTYKTLYTTTEIDNKIGNINTILESIING